MTCSPSVLLAAAGAALAFAGFALAAGAVVCRATRRRIEERGLERFHELARSYDEASRAAMEVALQVRHLTREELRVVASGAHGVLWHAEVKDPGGDQLNWDLRVFAAERGDFVNIEEVPPDYHVRAWYYGRSEPDMFRMAAIATGALRGGQAGYRQEFQCRANDGSMLWFQEDVKIETVGPGHWKLFGVSMDITDRKRAEEQREQVLKELQDALAHVKQLRGLLPICASCKKIRDDAGYWNQIDSYIRKHTDVEFSHSICPDCMKKLYPEFADDADE